MRFELFSLYFSIIFYFLRITADLFRKTCAIFIRKFRRNSGSKEATQVPTSGTFKEFLGDQQKIDKLIKKCFLDAIVLVLHICYCFLLEKQICKSSKWGRLQDVYGTQLRNVPGTRWWGRFGEVLGTSSGRRSYMFFKFNSETYLTYFDKLLETLWWTVVAKNLTWGSVVKFLF